MDPNIWRREDEVVWVWVWVCESELEDDAEQNIMGEVKHVL